jgi:hypothetical protein
MFVVQEVGAVKSLSTPRHASSIQLILDGEMLIGMFGDWSVGQFSSP